MLMFPGWEHEARGNRWIYARRWAEQCPVVLVQQNPTQYGRFGKSRPEQRLSNCRILTVAQVGTGSRGAAVRGLSQTEQLLNDMVLHGVRRPLLWAYDPSYLTAFHLLPAACRVFHATENYFRFEQISQTFLDRLRHMTAISDAIVAVSDGVAHSLLPDVREKTAVITNGCDFAAYSAPVVDSDLLRAAAGRRVMIYAGNINQRLDFGLLKTLAKENQNAFIVFFGAVAGLSKNDKIDWSELLRMTNVRYFGAVDPNRLPSLFNAADIGLIPYKKTALLVEDSFPLKTFEMIATGLPVVATLMKPIIQFSDRRALAVVDNEREFFDAVNVMSRAAQSPEQREHLKKMAAGQDYAIKFSEVLNFLKPRVHEVSSAPFNPFQTSSAEELLSMLDSRGMSWKRRVTDFMWLHCPDTIKPTLKNFLMRSAIVRKWQA